jgi:hypothetical protein
LSEAVRVAAEHGLELDVDDWTYALMVEHGAAPPMRPEQAQVPPGPYPGTGPGDDDVRPISWAVLEHAPDFLGLMRHEANLLAQERGLHVRIIDEDGSAITADYGPSRLNLYLQGDRVASASVG